MKKIINTFMSNQTVRRIRHSVSILFVISFILFAGLVIYRIPVVIERQKTREVVAKIQAQKLTLPDVLGQNLPPQPNPLLKDSTIEGIDANNNGIRDDVELAIFKLHPDSARIRAAELQYAMELLRYVTTVALNDDTLIAVVQEDERSYSCLEDQLSKDDTQIYRSDLGDLKREIVGMILNTEARRISARQNTRIVNFSSDLKGPHCDIDSSLLPN